MPEWKKTGFGLALTLCLGLSVNTIHAQIVGGGMHPRLPPGFRPRPEGPISRNAQPTSVAPQPAEQPVADTPLTLTQQPTTPPQVTFHNGELTISAQNSTLGEVLRAVRAQTGATVEIPSNATERVVANIGPGPAQEVLASLLNGSRYNYVLAGSASNPNELDHVILMAKTGADGQVVAQPVPGAPPPQTANSGEEAQGLDMQEAETPADDAGSPEAQGQQEAAQEQNNNNDQQSPFGVGQPPGVRSPQQLLQDLQQRQQQNGNQGFFPGTPAQQPQPEQ